jgi:peptidoglycan-associated lipoprotein
VTISYGEEQPAVFGSDEEAYGLNRRVEIVYR